MRIIIEVEGGEAEVSTQPAGRPSERGTRALGAATPPPEILAAAAAVGAQDAGPAPTEAPPGTGAPTIAIPSTTSRAPGAGPSDESAGAAPGSAEEPPATMVEEEEEE
jgi:hypothetical protein